MFEILNIILKGTYFCAVIIVSNIFIFHVNRAVMSVPPRPDPPVVGKVTHNSIELYWKAPEAVEQGQGDSRARYCIQEEELGPKSKGFGNVYSGYSTS